jgi:death on curing protein
VKPEFLDLGDVIEVHRLQLDAFGGLDGIRDRDLLESAVAQPQAAFGGTFLHEDLFAMAAAYLFHIVQNHPFIDGNKRTGLAVALTFLELNGYPIRQDSPALYDATIGVADGRVNKETFADLFRRLAPIRRHK